MTLLLNCSGHLSSGEYLFLGLSGVRDCLKCISDSLFLHAGSGKQRSLDPKLIITYKNGSALKIFI